MSPTTLHLWWRGHPLPGNKVVVLLTPLPPMQVPTLSTMILLRVHWPLAANLGGPIICSRRQKQESPVLQSLQMAEKTLEVLQPDLPLKPLPATISVDFAQHMARDCPEVLLIWNFSWTEDLANSRLTHWLGSYQFSRQWKCNRWNRGSKSHSGYENGNEGKSEAPSSHIPEPQAEEWQTRHLIQCHCDF